MSFFTAIFGKSATPPQSSSASPAGGGSTARAPASSSAGNGQRKLPAKDGSFTGEEAKRQIQTNVDLITSLTKKIEMDEERVKKEKLMAVEKNKAGNKTAAMAHLNTANKKQKEIDGLYNRKASLEEVVETIKRAELDRKYTQNLKAATAFMGTQQTCVLPSPIPARSRVRPSPPSPLPHPSPRRDPDAAQDIMTDAEDAMRNANEVGQILSQQIGVDAVDEDVSSAPTIPVSSLTLHKSKYLTRDNPALDSPTPCRSSSSSWRRRCSVTSRAARRWRRAPPPPLPLQPRGPQGSPWPCRSCPAGP